MKPLNTDKTLQSLNQKKYKELRKSAYNDIWRIKPVGIIEFCERFIDVKTLSNPQKKVLRAIYGRSPLKKMFNVEQAILRIGQGGGKNFIITIMVVYAIYRWCCLLDPHKYFNKYPHENFDILNFSQVNEAQARNVFFRTLGNMMKQTHDPDTQRNWFVSMMGMTISDYGRRSIKDKMLTVPSQYEHRGCLRVFCLDSTAKSVEGYTIFMAIMDEPSRANTILKYAHAKHQYNTAFTNQQTRFESSQRLMAVFAYPEQKGNDLLIHLYDKYAILKKKNDIEINKDANVLTAWYYNWKFNNPDRAKKLKQDYKRAYSIDPIDADRRFKAIVPPAEYGFFKPHYNTVPEAFNPKIISPVKYVQTVSHRDEKVKGEIKRTKYVALELLDVKGDERERFWGADFAVTGDRLVIVGGYGTRMTRPIAPLIQHRRDSQGAEYDVTVTIDCRPVIDIILIWDPGKQRVPIDYQNVEDVVRNLIYHYFPNSRAMKFDAYQTESIRQKLLDAGLRNTEALSFSNKQQVQFGLTVRHLVWRHGIEILPCPLLEKEMDELLFENGMKLDHPAGGSKDIWDALSICANLIVEGVSMGGHIDYGEETTDENTELKIFDQAIRQFISDKGRSPNDSAEMARYMREVCNQMWATETDVDHLFEEWQIWRMDLEEQVLGWREYANENIETHTDIIGGVEEVQDMRDDILKRI